MRVLPGSHLEAGSKYGPRLGGRLTPRCLLDGQG